MEAQLYSEKTCHGTCWERPLIPNDESIEEAMFFEELTPEKSPLNALYATNIDSVAEQFAHERAADPEHQLEVVIEGHTTLDKAYIIDFEYGGTVEFQGKSYSIEHAYMEADDKTLTRKDLHLALKEAGYDGFVMRGDYQYLGEPADDVAMFEADRFTATSVRMKIGGEWTPSLPLERARAIFTNWVMEPYMETGPEYSVESEFSFY